MTYLDRTDKHINGYVPTYLELASKIGISGIVCEIGVQRGGSLEFWQSLFPWGCVVGVDVDENAVWPEGTHKVVMDQSDDRLFNELIKFSHRGKLFDLIVDDASHDGVKTTLTFQNLWGLVRPGRWYVIEDWGVGYPGAPMFDPAMRNFARDLVDIAHTRNDVEQVTYRGGLIIIEKTI